MSGITERIAEVLKREPVVYDEDEDYLSDETANRLASLLVAELGLTEESAFEFTEPLSGTRKHHPMPKAEAQQLAASARPDRDAAALSRYVTPWTPA